MSFKPIAGQVYTAAIDQSWWCLTDAQRWSRTMDNAHRRTRQRVELRTSLALVTQRDAVAIIVRKLNEL